MSTKRRTAALAVVFLGVVFLGLSAVAPVSYSQSSYSRVDQLKAAFLTNFTHFIRWPNEQANTQLKLCVWGKAPLQEPLAQLIQNKTVRNKTLATRNVISLKQALDCQLVFISHEPPIPSINWLIQLRDSSVLTIADKENFAERGGMIELYIENNKLRFAINLATARQAGLNISSQLLNMAKIVDGRVP